MAKGLSCCLRAPRAALADVALAVHSASAADWFAPPPSLRVAAATPCAEYPRMADLDRNPASWRSTRHWRSARRRCCPAGGCWPRSWSAGGAGQVQRLAPMLRAVLDAAGLRASRAGGRGRDGGAGQFHGDSRGARFGARPGDGRRREADRRDGGRGARGRTPGFAGPLAMGGDRQPARAGVPRSRRRRVRVRLDACRDRMARWRWPAMPPPRSRPGWPRRGRNLS